ncbi:MAG: hypothetical protein JXJ04_05080 [Spirochaetales bacterium]|nr:hypothetical protein [Spirochaetales bacterium]
MANYQQLQIEANKIIRGTHFYRYSESSYFAHEIQMLKEGIRDYLLDAEPELALKIAEKIIKADGRILERVDDSMGNVGPELNDFCILWLQAASKYPAPKDGWIPRIVKLVDNDDYGCRDALLPNSHILLSMEEMQILYEFYKNRYQNITETSGSTSFSHINSAVNMGQVAIAMKNPQLYEASIRMFSQNPNTPSQKLQPEHNEVVNDMQMLDILKYYFKFGYPDYVLEVIKTREWEDRFRTDVLYLEEQVLKSTGDISALKKVQKQQYRNNPSLERLKEYLKDQNSKETKIIIEEALKIAETDTKLCRGLSVLLEYRCYEKALEIMIIRKEELDSGFYGTLLSLLDQITGKDLYLIETLIYRALLSDILNRAYAKAYKYAASYYRKLINLDKKIETYPEAMENHDVFLEQIREKHFRKHSFWKRVER